MSINFTTLFTQLGSLSICLNDISTFITSNTSGHFPYDVAAIETAYASNPNWVPNLQNDANNQDISFLPFILDSVQTAAQTTVINTVAAALSQPTLSLDAALTEMIREMTIGSAYKVSTNTTGTPTIAALNARSGSVSGASSGTPIVITSAAHGLSTGEYVTIISVGGNTNANGTWVITVTGVNTFSLNGSSYNSGYTSGGTWTTANNVGNGNVVATLKNGNGGSLQMPYAETINITCVNDSVSGTAFAGNETFLIQGAASTIGADVFWPRGSGASQLINVVNAQSNSFSNNFLNNGGFDTWIGSPAGPAFWEITSGNLSGGSQNIAQESSTFYAGTNAIKFGESGSTSDPIIQHPFNNPGGAITNATNTNPIVITSASHGLSTSNIVVVTHVKGNTAANGTWTITVIDTNTFSLNLSIANGNYIPNTGNWSTQVAGSSSGASYGTSLTLAPLTVYGINFWCKTNSATGQIRVSLWDTTNDVVVLDNSGNACSLTTNLSALTTTYASLFFAFATPKTLPITYAVQVDFPTVIASRSYVWIDQMALAYMIPLYSGGPKHAIFAGSTNFAIGDAYTDTIANLVNSLSASFFERTMGLNALGLELPITGTTNLDTYF